MDQFYQTLRKIQKKERNNATLAQVEETFYDDIQEYLNSLRKQIRDEPLSNVYQILNEAQRIATEICERREHKITDAAVVNIHRSFHLFTSKPHFDLAEATPLNLTPEEEKFYYSLIDTLKDHRDNLGSSEVRDEKSDDKKVIKPRQSTPVSKKTTEKTGDEVLDRIEEIAESKPITDEKREPVEKQIAKSRQNALLNTKTNIEDNPNAVDENDEFVDFESEKMARDVELVTMLVYDDVGAIVGVDEKIYGPFRPQDLVTLPYINAKVFFKNRKGRQVRI